MKNQIIESALKMAEDLNEPWQLANKEFYNTKMEVVAYDYDFHAEFQYIREILNVLVYVNGNLIGLLDLNTKKLTQGKVINNGNESWFEAKEEEK